MKVIITKDRIIFDGKRQKSEVGSRGFSADLLWRLLSVLIERLGGTGEIANFTFDSSDKTRSISEHFRIIADAMDR